MEIAKNKEMSQVTQHIENTWIYGRERLRENMN